MTQDERLWNRREVAEYLGVTPKSVSRLSIPRVTIQGRGERPMVRYDPAEVKAWVAARKSRTLLSRSA